MNIKNIGSKIVNIGTIVLMPGDTATLDSKWDNVPAIDSLVEHGFLAVEAFEATAPEADLNIKEDNAKDEAAEATDRRGGRRRGNR